MQVSNAPSKSAVPFADSGTKNTIPVASQIGVTPGGASFTDGFPPLTMTPLAAGGVPPYGADFNGILNFLSAAVRWTQAGGSYPYDAAFAASVGGYPKGAVLANAAGTGLWLNLADNNTANPDSGGANWVAMGPGLGIGQAWTNVTASRAVGVTYTNSTNKPIMVSATVSGTVPNSTVSIALLVGSPAVGVGINALVTNANPTQWSICCEGVVPPGQPYKLDVVQGSLLAWVELR